jgi:hypothetical protein
MAGIAELNSYRKENGEKKLNDLLDSYVIISEKITGSNFYVQREGSKKFYYRRDDNRWIGIIDRTVSSLYEKAIKFFEDSSIELPEKKRFGFEYFPNLSPGFVEYQKLPKNNLILNRILEKDSYGKTQKVIEDSDSLLEWADLLQVSTVPVLFEGYLEDSQKEKLKAILDSDFSFNSIMESIGKEDKPFLSDERIDSLVFKFIDPMTEKITRLKMSDLKERKDSSEERRGTVDAVSIFILDLLQFIEEKGLDTWEITGLRSEEKYLNLICLIYNDYLKERSNSIEGMNFQTKDFGKSPEFQLNPSFIKNAEALKNIEKNETNKKILQIMLGSLRKKRDPELPNDVLTPMVIRDFNEIVNKIKVSTTNDGEGLLSFGEYLHQQMQNNKKKSNEGKNNS